MNMLKVAILAILVQSGAVSGQTLPGFKVGGQFSKYYYGEPVQDMQLTGTKVGVTGAYTFVRDSWFAKGEVRYAYGKLKHGSVPGKTASVPDTTTELRLVVGKDFPFSNWSVSPYAGLGYRNLFDDMRGYTSVGSSRYRRYSEYVYIPVGASAPVRITDEWSVIPSLEYDLFVRGRQDTRFTDTNLGYADALNSQKGGYGARASVLLDNGRWSIGPWVHHWNIRKSDVVPIDNSGHTAWEPLNRTWDAGVEFTYRF